MTKSQDLRVEALSSEDEVVLDKRVAPKRKKVLNYSLRLAKNIERKMMGHAFARLSPLAPLSKYRYVGFGSEFFNDFTLYHETLGIEEMISIEEDHRRVKRCQFNRPFKCVSVRKGTATSVLPELSWKPRSIVWLDYVDKLNTMVLEDLSFVVQRVISGSMLVWTVNAEPWTHETEGDLLPVSASELHPFRISEARRSLAPYIVPDEWVRKPLAKWGLATLFYRMMIAQINVVLDNRNSALEPKEKVKFHQCFHFRYADGQQMLTVGGVVLNTADRCRLGNEPFEGLDFIREGIGAITLRPPVLTGREVRHLVQSLPLDQRGKRRFAWLGSKALIGFADVYRYFPIFAESEL